MRSDMQHVFNEVGCSSRNSKGFGNKSEARMEQKCWASTDAEGFAKRTPIKRNKSGHRCRRYNVLRNYILSQVGRRWDAVYSDICYNIDMRQDDIRNQVDYLVCRNVYIKNGEAYEDGMKRYYFSKDVKVFAPTYVHPETGILCKTPERRRYRRKKKEQRSCLWITGEAFYVMDVRTGIWYKCWLKKIPTCRQPLYRCGQIVGVATPYAYRDVNEKVYDAFLKVHTKGEYSKSTYGAINLYCYKKLQVGKKELKQIKEWLASLDGATSRA